jgi:hypothetical protein
VEQTRKGRIGHARCMARTWRTWHATYISGYLAHLRQPKRAVLVSLARLIVRFLRLVTLVHGVWCPISAPTATSSRLPSRLPYLRLLVVVVTHEPPPPPSHWCPFSEPDLVLFCILSRKKNVTHTTSRPEKGGNYSRRIGITLGQK